MRARGAAARAAARPKPATSAADCVRPAAVASGKSASAVAGAKTGASAPSTAARVPTGC
jgi:hypothetical protein